MDDIQAFAENVWIVGGPPVRDMGEWFTTRMTVVKLSSGSMWLNSPVAVPPGTLDRIKEMGAVRYLVAATPRHIWRLEKWHGLFPDAELWVTPQILNKLKLMTVLPKQKLSYTGILGNELPSAWASDMDQLVFEGSYLFKEVFFFHRKSRTVIVDDMIQIHPMEKGKPFLNFLIKLVGAGNSRAVVALGIRMTFTNRKLARQSFKKLMSWDFDKLIIAHGPCIQKDAKASVEMAFRWLQS
jgi:hypothetical protein